MYIETDNPNLSELAPEGVDWEDRAVFGKSGVAQVTRELGERLIDEYEDIRKKGAGDEKQDEEDSQDLDN